MRWSITFFLFLLLAGCGRSAGADLLTASEPLPTTEVTRLVEVTRIVEIVREVTVVVTPTPQPSHTPTLTPTDTPLPLSTPTPVPTPIPSVPTTHVENGVNLRGGPGTDYPLIGGLAAGDRVEVLARNEAGDWYQITQQGGKAWVAVWLLSNAPPADTLPIAVDIPAPPTPTSVPPTPAQVISGTDSGAPESATPASPEPRFRVLGEEIEGGGWRFNVKEVHKRKAVYFYNRSYVAHGNFLVVIIDAVNLQSGTDYFARNIKPYVVDIPGTVWQQSSSGTSYAQWQYEGISNVFTDVNPGVFTRMALVFDLPPETGRLLLSTRILEWVDLGVFSELPLEE